MINAMENIYTEAEVAEAREGMIRYSQTAAAKEWLRQCVEIDAANKDKN